MFHPSTLLEAIRYGVSYSANVALTTVTNETVFAPASNVAGAVVWAAGISTTQNNGSNTSTIGLIAKSSAPASGTDGDVLLACICRIITGAGEGQANIAFERGRFVAAGKGLYFRNSAQDEAIGYRWVLYTLLSGA